MRECDTKNTDQYGTSFVGHGELVGGGLLRGGDHVFS
jgi:hypothetical protein